MSFHTTIRVTLGVAIVAAFLFQLLVTWTDWRPDFRVMATLTSAIVLIVVYAIASGMLAKTAPAHASHHHM